MYSQCKAIELLIKILEVNYYSALIVDSVLVIDLGGVTVHGTTLNLSVMCLKN